MKEINYRKSKDKKRWKYDSGNDMLRSYMDDALQILYWMLWLIIVIAVCTFGCFFRLLFI